MGELRMKIKWVEVELTDKDIELLASFVVGVVVGAFASFMYWIWVI